MSADSNLSEPSDEYIEWLGDLAPWWLPVLIVLIVGVMLHVV